MIRLLGLTLTRVALGGLIVLTSGLSLAQEAKDSSPKGSAVSQAERNKKRDELDQQRRKLIAGAEKDGIEVRIKDIARFRGARSNQLQGIGLIVGLSGSGDTKNTPFTANLLANAMREKTLVDVKQLKAKNVAVVFVTAELPAFASPGNRIDITVTSAGDATSLQGGYLLRTPLFSASDDQSPYVVAMGPISIGGFNAANGGAGLQKNHTTVGKMPELGIVERAVDTKLVFENKLYLELHEADFTTAHRIAEKLNEVNSAYQASALDGGTIVLNLLDGKTPVQAMSEIEPLTVFSDTQASILINENTGTIVLGGNVRLAPAVVAKGSLTVKIDQELIISQPAPFSNGETVIGSQSSVEAVEEKASVTLMGPTTTVADLARIFQALKISATDMIAILEALRSQGSLKARIKVQ